MKNKGKIVTIGLTPAWDTVCKVDGIEWGEHNNISGREDVPAGKALNINRALCWMNSKSVAGGLWGCDDYERMLKAVGVMRKFVDIKFTKAAGETRQNINLVDVCNNRDMHLRSASKLANKKSLSDLKKDIQKLIKKDRFIVFSGSLPKGMFKQVKEIIDLCREGNCHLAIDSSGEDMKKIVDKGRLWLRSGNLEELRELLNVNIKDNVKDITKAGKGLLDKAEIVLISRGRKGAVAVTKTGAWKGCFVDKKRKVVSTVGCGDYFLAGFLNEFKISGEVESALKAAIQASASRAWRLTENKSWNYVQRNVKVVVDKI